MTTHSRIMAAAAMGALLAAAPTSQARTDEVVTRHENSTRCHHVATLVIRDLETQGRTPSPRLVPFKAVLFGIQMRSIREVAEAGARARPTRDIRAEVDALRDQGEDALHAELRRCWALFSAQPEPDDLI